MCEPLAAVYRGNPPGNQRSCESFTGRCLYTAHCGPYRVSPVGARPVSGGTARTQNVRADWSCREGVGRVGRCLRAATDSQLSQPAAQRAWLHTKQLGGASAALNPPERRAEHALNVIAFDLFERRPNGCRDPNRRQRDVAEGDHAVRRKDGGPVYDVFELADIARPVVLLQGARDRVGERLDRSVHYTRKTVRQVLSQQRDVITPFAQRRQRDRKHVQPVVQVVAKAVLPDFLGEIAIGRGHHTHVNIDGARAAQSLELPFLEHPQEFWLQLGRQIADLVEKERSSMRVLESAYLARMGASEGSTLTSEQLALHQSRGKCGAIEGDELGVGSGAATMNLTRDEFLARARLTEQQDRRRGRRDLLETKDDIAPGRTLANQRFVVRALVFRVVGRRGRTPWGRVRRINARAVSVATPCTASMAVRTASATAVRGASIGPAR